jgi:carbon monoxide dehydrogenase subunit G
MRSFTIARHVDADPDLVFDTLSDFEHAAERIGNIERIEILTDGPIAAGTRFRETRKIFGKEATEELTISVFDQASRHYAVECESCGCRSRTDVRCTEDGTGTLVSMETTYQPVSMLAKLMAPIGWMMIGTMRKCIEQDLDDLMAHLSGRKLATEPVA